jgi:hypothetical protein
MAKVAKAIKSTSVLKDAKLEIKNLKAELKALKAAHKKELSEVVSTTYDRAIHAAFDQFEQKEIAREAVIEKAVNQALAQFEKSFEKKAKKTGSKVKPAKATKKKALSKKKA